MTNQKDIDAETLFHELKPLIELPSEYVSHETALFFLGQIKDIPSKLTIVSPRRRRNRIILGRPLYFICFSSEKLKPVQSVSMCGGAIRVSTLEKTLVDLLTDFEHSPEIEKICNYFSVLPYNESLILGIAKGISDTVLKRTSFLLAWAGRISAKDIPTKNFTRTPIRLDPRLKEEDSIWDRRFFLRFPSKLLIETPKLSHEVLDSASRKWIEFRTYPPFKEYVIKCGVLPIRNDSSLNEQKWLEDFFVEHFRSLSQKTLYSLLNSYDMENLDQEDGQFPVILKKWLRDNPNVLEYRKSEIMCWIEKHLNSINLRILGTALTFGFFLGMYSEILQSFAKYCYDLLNSGHFQTVKFLCEEFFKQKMELPSPVWVAYARLLSREGDFKGAIAILDRGKNFFEQKENAAVDLGELTYALGNVFRAMGKTDNALVEMYVAREYFMAANDLRGIALVDSALGNIFIMRGKPKEAKRYYLSALSKMRTYGNKSAQASLLGNLGLVEYDSGNLRKANMYFQKAAALHRANQHFWNEAIATISRGKALLTMGYFLQAAKVFKDAHKLKSIQKHTWGIYECSALLGWTTEYLGKFGVAQAWWNSVPPLDKFKTEPRIFYVVTALKAMTHLFRYELAEALKMYEQLLFIAENYECSQLAIGDAYHGIGFCQTLLGYPQASKSLKKALECLAECPLRLQYRLATIFAKVSFPELFPDIDLGNAIQFFFETNGYEPFWGHYAAKLLQIGIPEAKQYLAYHLSRASNGTIKAFLKYVPGFCDVLNKIEVDQQRGSEFLTYISDGVARPMHQQEYLIWRESPNPTSLFFDGPRGILSFGANIAYLKPKSILNNILCNLFAAFPQTIDLETLYKDIWGTPFDPECDLGAIKSALQRLRKILKSVNPGIGLKRRKSSSLYGGVEITICCRWEAVL